MGQGIKAERRVDVFKGMTCVSLSSFMVLDIAAFLVILDSCMPLHEARIRPSARAEHSCCAQHFVRSFQSCSKAGTKDHRTQSKAERA